MFANSFKIESTTLHLLTEHRSPVHEGHPVGSVMDPSDHKDASMGKSTFSTTPEPSKEVKKEESELIMFRKNTAKVTRCDIQPMQSPQILNKNKNGKN